MTFDYILLICLFILFLFQPETAPVSDDECFKSPDCSNVGYSIKKIILMSKMPLLLSLQLNIVIIFNSLFNDALIKVIVLLLFL